MQQISPRTRPEYDVEFQDGDPYIRHLLMISQHQTLALKDTREERELKTDYTFDGSVGQGVNIYVLNDGFNIDRQVSRQSPQL